MKQLDWEKMANHQLAKGQQTTINAEQELSVPE